MGPEAGQEGSVSNRPRPFQTNSDGSYVSMSLL